MSTSGPDVLAEVLAHLSDRPVEQGGLLIGRAWLAGTRQSAESGQPCQRRKGGSGRRGRRLGHRTAYGDLGMVRRARSAAAEPADRRLVPQPPRIDRLLQRHRPANPEGLLQPRLQHRLGNRSVGPATKPSSSARTASPSGGGHRRSAPRGQDDSLKHPRAVAAWRVASRRSRQAGSSK